MPIPQGFRRVRVRIEGRVQGVGFRAFVEREALQRRLGGYVRNRRDGGVEAVFVGRNADIEAMILACRRGPPSSRVDFVKVLDEDGDAEPEFVIASTA